MYSEEQGEEVRVFLRTWEKDIFRRVCVATLDSNSDDPDFEISQLGQLIDAHGLHVSVVSIIGDKTLLWKLAASIWAVGSVKNWLTTRVLILTSWGVVYNG